MEVRVHGLGLLPAACRRAALFRKAARLALGPKARRRGELNLIFTTGPRMRAINRRFLRHDRVTDVIAFPYDVPPAFGDVYVCVGQAKRQTADMGHPLMVELITLVLHGTLHLAGHDDVRPKDRKRMFARQDALIARLGVRFQRGVHPR